MKFLNVGFFALSLFACSAAAPTDVSLTPVTNTDLFPRELETLQMRPRDASVVVDLVKSTHCASHRSLQRPLVYFLGHRRWAVCKVHEISYLLIFSYGCSSGWTDGLTQRRDKSSLLDVH